MLTPKKKQFDEREQDWLVQNFCLWRPPRFDVIQAEPRFSSSLKNTKLEACVVEWLTPQTPDLEVWGSSLARHIVFLDKELYSTLSCFTQVYKWVPATYCWGVTLQWTSIPSGGSSNTPRCLMLMKPG